MRRRVPVVIPMLMVVGSPLAAQPFEKVGKFLFRPSPTGIPYTVPASSRAAGWTIAAPQSRLGLAGSNPAFFATSVNLATAPTGTQCELAIEGIYQYEDVDHDGDSHETSFSAATGKVALGRLAMGLAYQHPYQSGPWVVRTVFRQEGTGELFDEDFEVLCAGAAFAVAPHVLIGAAGSWQRMESGGFHLDAYQVTLGAEVGVASSTFAAALKSEPFGEDSEMILAPSWLQLDARVPIGSAWALGARFGTGSWNNSRNGMMNTPLDAGAGVAVQIIPTLQLLGGVHHMRERRELDEPVTAWAEDYVYRDQGTFLDAGLVLGVSMFHMALSVEDSHVFDASSPTTWVSLSMNAAY